MIFIEKSEEPKWLAEFKRKNNKETYDSKKFRPYISKLNECLLVEQKYLCAYCCCEIDNYTSHNEHIEPRHAGVYESNRSLDYNNIVASCYGFQGQKTCGPKKDNDYNEKLFVSPLNPECENIFRYLPNGAVEGDDYTIGLLNLNSYKLQQARKAVYNTIKDLDKETICMIYDENVERLPAFINVAKWYVRNM